MRWLIVTTPPTASTTRPNRCLIVLHHQHARSSGVGLHPQQCTQVHRRQNLSTVRHNSCNKRRRHRHTLQVSLSKYLAYLPCINTESLACRKERTERHRVVLLLNLVNLLPTGY